jgi:hypothetical protein
MFALARDMREHSVPLALRLRVIITFAGTAVRNEAQLTCSKFNITSARTRVSTTGPTWRRTAHDHIAVRAFRDFGSLALFARRGRDVLCTPVDIERPSDIVGRKAVPIDGAGMVEEYTVGLAFVRTQTATCHLSIETQLPGRAGENDATDRRTIPAFS